MATVKVSTIRDLLKLSKEERKTLCRLLDESDEQASIQFKIEDPEEEEKKTGCG